MSETNRLMKLSNIDLIKPLREVVNSNTRHYLTDFVYDVRRLRQAQPDDYIFMSRECGAYLFKIQDILLRDTYDYNSWIHYSPEEVLAFYVQVDKVSKGIATGALYQMDYAAAVEWTKKNALPVKAADLIFADGHKEVVAIERLSSFHLPEGVKRGRYLPADMEELKSKSGLLGAYAKQAIKEITPEQFRDRLLARSLQRAGYAGRDLIPVADERLNVLFQKGFTVYRIAAGGAEPVTRTACREDWRNFDHFRYGIRTEDKSEFDALDREIIRQGVREQIREAKQKKQRGRER